MDIRKLIDVLENIQNRDSDDTEKDTSDVENDIDDVENDIDDVEDDTEKDVEKDTDSEEDSEDDSENIEKDDENKDPVEEFKSIGNSLGHGLYSIVPYNSLEAVWKGNSVPNPSTKILRILKESTKGRMNFYDTSINYDDVVTKRIISMIIYNDNNKRFFKVYVNGKSKSIKFSPELESLKNNGYISGSQVNIIGKLNDTIKDWVNSIPSYFPVNASAPGEYKSNSTEDKKWKSSEKKLLGMIENSGYAETEKESEPDWARNVDWSKVDLHGKNKPKLDDIEKEMLDNMPDVTMKLMYGTPEEKKEAKNLFSSWELKWDEYQQSKNNKEGVGREKR